jgi:hypothetical protein
MSNEIQDRKASHNERQLLYINLSITVTNSDSSKSCLNLVTKQDLEEMGNKIMSQLSDFGDRVQASFDAISAAVDETKTKVDAIIALITTLQNSPGQITPADQATLDKIEASAKDLAAKVKVLDDATAAPPTVPTV